MKKYLADIAATACILFLVGAFFFSFFFPEPKLLVTPDFGRSDSWHFSIPTKFLLWQSLKENTLPLWSAHLGGGFPVFAEGQVGALYPLNLILFKFLDFSIAYNLALASTVAILSLGTYFFLHTISQSRLGALLGATSITLSGIVIPQLPHMTLLQGLSLMPWILLATHRLINTLPLFPGVAYVAVLLALQIFSGFPQATFITVLLAGAYVLWHKKAIAAFVFALCLGITIGAVQLIPSFEFLRQSSVASGFTPDEASYFSYPWNHLATLINPYALGNPKEGTYPHFSTFDGSIFWENSGFVGFVPLLFAVLGLWRSTPFFLVAGLASLFLMTGSHSPTYLVYSFWPFTLFRVPSRFLWVFVLSLLTLSAYGVSKIRSKLLLVLLIVLHTAHLWITWHDYHALVPAGEWLAKPSIAPLLSQKGRLATVGIENTHNEAFNKHGWTSMAPYAELRNAAAVDSNVFWDISSTTVYAGRALQRQYLLGSLLLSGLSLSLPQHTATVSAFGEKIFSLTGTSTIVSSWPLDTQTLQKKDTISTLSVFHNPNVLPHVYLADRPVVATGLSQAAEKLHDASFVLGHSVLVLQPVADIKKGTGTARIIEDSNTRIRITVSKNTNQTILVLADTYYPGWRATVDGSQTNIFPVNIAQRGVVVPLGDHEVIFSYQPQSFRIGTRISLISLLSLIFLLAAYPLLAARLRRFASARRLVSGSSRNLGQRKPHRG